ncbi:DUF4062 domain-containing protein [Branchiibius cervicis]|uniref:DUF4062 domain-containing protein n=1 Tax=Branchiibius cervicis TaxID=908252 RepID=A0ABW2AVP7_9MICO
MPTQMNGLLVLIASPTDTKEERAAVRNGLVDWNIQRGRRDRIAVLPWLWERSAVPMMGGHPQALVNSQAVDQADVVVAFFDARLGSPTDVDVSGTAEEINRAITLGKPVHVYFSTEPLDRSSLNTDQYAALQDFRHDLESRGLLGEYSDPTDLAAQVARAVEHDITANDWSDLKGSQPSASPSPRGAILNWHHDHEKEQQGLDQRGNMKYRTLSNDLVVQNTGDQDAEDLRFTVSAIGDTPFHFDEPQTAVTVLQGSQMSWLLIFAPHMGSTGRTVLIEAEWREGNEARSKRWTVTLKN